MKERTILPGRGRGLTGRQRVVLVALSATVLLSAWGLYGIFGQRAKDTARDDAIHDEDDEDFPPKSAAELKREVESLRRELKKRTAIGGRPKSMEQEAAPQSPPDPEREARRERGQWREIATFEGLKKHQTSSFLVPGGGWRYRWECDGDATIRLLDAKRKSIGEEIEVFGGERGTQFVAGGPGEYSLRIETDALWKLVVEE